MTSSGTSTPTNKYSPLPPIKSNVDRDFINDLNRFIESELNKINTEEEEQKYLVWKDAFNKVIEHVVAYKPILTAIKKEYEDTINTIKSGHREADFLQLKLMSMASEPSTIRNYKKRADELEERIQLIKKENEKLEQELREMNAFREEREKRPKTAETPRRQLKTDNRFIPGLTLEEMTDMKGLQKKYEALDRQLKELNICLKTRFLPKTHKVQLKETLDAKVATRDQLLQQSLVYKAKCQRLKIALEAAQAYNQMKPPHQTVGDAVTIAFHQATGIFQEEKDKLDKEYGDHLVTSNSTEDDDPNKEKEAEMMLEYIEKFNELFEDGLFEEAAVHAANSPKGILRTQATLAKFRDAPSKGKGRSPLLAFCDALMSSVKAAGRRPNEALSLDCVEAGLKENRVDMVHHWLAQDRLTLSHQMGVVITDHCSCQLPCLCGCQSMAQSIFTKLKFHFEAVLTMLKQGKVQNALQHAKLWHCITSDKVKEVLSITDCPHFIQGLLAIDQVKRKPILGITLGSVLQCLMDLNKPQLMAAQIDAMSRKPSDKNEETSLPLSRAVFLDRSTSQEQWLAMAKHLDSSGHHEAALQLFAMAYVSTIVQQSNAIVQNDPGKKGVSFSHTVQTKSDSEDELSGSSDDVSSSRSDETPSREISPDTPTSQKSPRESILKKSLHDSRARKHSPSGKRVSLLGDTQSPSLRFAQSAEDKQVDLLRPSSKVSSSVRLIDNDPYTSNPESAGESEAE